MAVESAADRAALFSEDDFAEAALYTPPGGGVAVACSIVYDRGRGQAALTERGIEARGAERGAMVNADEVPVVKKGGTFAVGVETLKVAGVPKLDETGRIWTVELVLSA